ncbi:MAG: winged helix-turn-helix domain-containing protein [bacterium]|nr:winged helix-turn-helix domain-containing protein [bacterium]
MLEQLFGSTTRVKLLRLFFANPEREYFVRELTRRIDQRINSVRQELKNLEEAGIVAQLQRERKKYYRLRLDFPLFSELRTLMLKAQLLYERDLAKTIASIGQIKYLVLTGQFLGVKDLPTDMLIIGNVNRSKLHRLLKKFQEFFEYDINYTVMSVREFEFRNQLTDRFIFDIMENDKKVVVIDKLTKPKKQKKTENEKKR